MKSKIRLVFASMILLLAAFACNLPSASTTPAQVPSPQVAIQTVSPGAGTGEMPPAVRTDAAGLPAQTVAITLPPTAGTESITPGLVTITSTENTNCRKGPGTMYEILGQLLVGQTSRVIARYQNGKFWLIENPSQPGQECWVWDQTTRVHGDPASLPEATQPPTPNVTVNLTLYATIAPINYAGACPVTVELTGSYTINTAAIIAYQWKIGSLLVASGSVTAGSSGTFSSTDQITITTTTTNPVTLSASAPPKTVTTYPISFSIVCY